MVPEGIFLQRVRPRRAGARDVQGKQKSSLHRERWMLTLGAGAREAQERLNSPPPNGNWPTESMPSASSLLYSFSPPTTICVCLLSYLAQRHWLPCIFFLPIHQLGHFHCHLFKLDVSSASNPHPELLFWSATCLDRRRWCHSSASKPRSASKKDEDDQVRTDKHKTKKI